MEESVLMLRKLSSLFFVFYLSIVYLSAQEFPAQRIIPKKFVENETQKIKKQVVEQPYQFNAFEMQCLYTLSFFPELKDVCIVFKHKKIKTTMAARPRWDFIFRSKSNRVYEVVFNSDTTASAIHFSELPLNAQIGILGHEYCHLVDYMNRGNVDMLSFGLRYLINDKFKAKVEHNVDKLAIDKGLGWQLHDFSAYVLHDDGTPAKYKNYKRKFYLSPEDIIRSIKKEYSGAL